MEGGDTIYSSPRILTSNSSDKINRKVRESRHFEMAEE